MKKLVRDRLDPAKLKTMFKAAKIGLERTTGVNAGKNIFTHPKEHIEIEGVNYWKPDVLFAFHNGRWPEEHERATHYEWFM